jgi:phosphohistidine phosphatase
MRHAKSSWKYDLQDVERPLKGRGRTDIAVIAEAFKKKYPNPEIVFCSSAVRAMETCKIFLYNVGFLHKKPEYFSQLYDFGGNNLTEFIKNIDDQYQHVMVFGHNHAMTYFTNSFGDIYIDNLPTSGLVILEFDIERWQDLRPGRTLDIFIPRELR